MYRTAASASTPDEGRADPGGLVGVAADESCGGLPRAEFAAWIQVW